MDNDTFSRPEIKPTPIADVFSYIDTLGLSSSRLLPSRLLAALRKECGSMIFRPVRDKFDLKTVWMFRLELNQPTERAVKLLEAYKRRSNHYFEVYRLHLAFDFDERPNVTREELIGFIKTAVHLRHRRDTDEFVDYLGTLYWIEIKGRNSRPAKNAALYCDKDGRLDGECEKIHLEVRAEKKRAVIAANVTSLFDVRKINPERFFAKTIKVANHKPALRKIIDKAIRVTLATTPNPHVDISKRVLTMFRRMGCDTLTGFKRMFPVRAGRLPDWDCLNIAEQLNWVPMKMKCEEMSPLSPPARKRMRLDRKPAQGYYHGKIRHRPPQ